MNFSSKYLIDSQRANEIRHATGQNDTRSLLTGRITFMNIFWAIIMIVIGVIILSIGVDNWSGSTWNYIGLILGLFSLMIGVYMFKGKKSNFLLLNSGFLTIKPATDNSFQIPIETIKSIKIKSDQNRIRDWSDVGANSAKSAVNEYKIYIRTDEIDEIDISFDFSGIKMTDLSRFLSNHNLI